MLRALGFSNYDRLLIINADDFGITRQANRAIIDLLEKKYITSASLIAAAEFTEEAISLCNQSEHANVGVHLTLTDGYKPVSSEDEVKTLLDENGRFFGDPYFVETKADRDHVKKELSKQIEKLISLGIDPTHLDSHQGSLLGLHTGHDFMDIVFDLCEMFGLPFLFPKNIVNQPFFSKKQKESFVHIIGRAEDRKLPLIDDMISSPYELKEGESYLKYKSKMIRAIEGLTPGITQLVVHPEVIDGGKSTTAFPIKREMEYMLLQDPDVLETIRQEGIITIS
ncbi:ChbG/HpnK family deacetylase [Paenibacillus sediminis]|uniref:Glycoside hydrolase/deacetylase ChbG (UPF0249 family) n=1 Tax=Paenibacillus sediminis TaxID=664909 RepID=A0ABS4H1U8_9BACL|nr:ChbG/HpnK family deacetylase [Paenibacillus sediminis]MBP1936498.1 putative glycoside hydrolase/deacetylase ChbG (UPF0249 family) [Paenibacillus sediminis]